MSEMSFEQMLEESLKTIRQNEIEEVQKDVRRTDF